MTLLDASNPFWDRNIMDLIQGIKDALPKQPLIIVAKQIAAAFSLVYIAVRAYAMISGDGKLEVMPLFRPFIINLAILNISSVMALLQFPGNQAEKLLSTSFNENAALINSLQDQKVIVHDALIWKIYAAAETLKTTARAANENDMFSTLENITTDIGLNLTLYARIATVKMTMMFQDIINNMIIGIFKGIAYCLFFITVIIMYILSVLGPISFAFSISGAWKDSWIHWAGKVIAVSFYNTIGFIVLNISCAVLDYGFQQEIDRIKQIIATTSDADFLNGALHFDSYLIYVFIAMVIALAGIACTPLISTWFLQTSGADGFSKSMKNATVNSGKAVASGAKSVVNTFK